MKHKPVRLNDYTKYQLSVELGKLNKSVGDLNIDEDIPPIAELLGFETSVCKAWGRSIKSWFYGLK